MAQTICVHLNKGEAPSLGFRLQGGKDFGTPLLIQKVNYGSPAEKSGLLAGDSVIKINTTDVYNLRHKDAQDVIIRAGPSFEITVQRGGSTWKPSVAPTGALPTTNNYSPVTKTSLAAKPQPSIGAIGTGHNLAAKPFNTQVNGAVNGVPKLVSKQYNSPVGLYSEQSIAETLSAQAEVLSTGALGVNFKKNEKNYDASNSEVFRMVHEAEKEPRDQEPETEPGVVSLPVAVAGLRHVTAPEQRPVPSTPQLPPGQNICADCERLIVGVFVRIKDKNLHVECFKCATCGTSLKNVGYYNVNNKLYCDVHAKLAARSNPPGSNLVPVTTPPVKAPAGTISAALATRPLPTAGPLSPTSSNITPQPFQAGTNFTASPRPFSSVSSPLSPSSNSYSSLPKSAPVSAPFTSAPAPDKGRSVQNIVWPPPPPPDDQDLPTATPLYFPPPSNIQHTPPPRKPSPPILSEFRHIENSEPELEELTNLMHAMDSRMSLCSSERTSSIDRRSAVEHIEMMAGTQMMVESVLKQRSNFPPALNKDIKPKVEVTTEPKQPSGRSSLNSNEPRVITSVCVCTNSCCNAAEGTLCDNCPMRDSPAHLKRPCDYQKAQQENSVPQRYGSPQITGVSVTINNPGKIRDVATNAFAQIPTKNSRSALASALAVAPSEPFTPVHTHLEPVALPEETKPYLPPERPIIVEPKQPKPPKEVVENPKPDTPFVSALKIAPERPYTPVAGPAPVRKKKPKEDPVLKDLPKPVQWMSMVTALTTASDRPYSPLVLESASIHKEEIEIHEASEVKESHKEVIRRPVSNDLAKPFMREKYDPINDKPEDVQPHFPPISDELKSSYEYRADYSQVKSEISSQIIEQSHVEKEVLVESNKMQECLSCSKKKEEKKIEKQTEETTFKKPLELSSYLRKSDYLPQYQMSLNYDETIQLPHHKDIKKLLPSDQNKPRTNNAKLAMPPSSKPTTTTNQPDESNARVPLMSFQPVVHEPQPPKTTFSPRPGSLTPSMINKPAPALPYYQASLVTSEHSAPGVNLLDPKSPAVSRSPSPCPDGRVASPFPRHAPRAVSPAAGPPPNPLKAKPIPTFSKEERMLEEAKRNITSYIPHHKEAIGSVQESFQVTLPLQLDSSKQCKRQEQLYEAGASSSRSEIGHIGSTTVCESAQMQQTQQFGKSQSKTIETSEDSSVQIQRRKVVSEEFEEKSKHVEIKTSTSTGPYPFQKVKNPETVDHQGIIGLHVTNPQPIVSPFLSKRQEPVQVAPPPPAPKRYSIPVSEPPKIPPPIKSVAPPVNSNATPSSSASANRPIVPLPNAGSGGGRQAGAIGFAPKRGRGVLNLGGLGSRVALCGQCHGHIRGPFITALGKIWCPEHFICATPTCRRQLQDLGFVEEQGQLYCEYCFEQYLAPPCSKCNSKIKGDCLKAIGKNFHPECFNCSYCGKLFGNTPFFLEDGAPYCENDWNELFTTKCYACGFPVEAGDRWVEALNNNYHSQCFNCSMCKKNLEGQSFFAKGGRPFCKNHAR